MQNENIGLWDLSGEVIDIRPDKLSYLIDIEGRMFVRGRSKIKPVFKVASHEEDKGGVFESESKGVGVSPVDSETPSITDTSAPLRRSARILEKCISSSSSASAYGTFSGTDVRHVPFCTRFPALSWFLM